jgi:3-hydroxy-9,10-secoandrosta-1,3,5(10)-triene-9,17-dione monooxygenase reductase component
MSGGSAKATFSGRDFRDALSSFATGVTIVTARDAAGQPIGMTASSFNSVSVDPPLVLWSVTKTAFSAQAFRDAKHFSIHVLKTTQTEMSGRFAKPGTDKFAGLEIGETAEGVPTLPEALARFDCRQWAVYEGGDHWILVGEVLDLALEKGQGLVFSGGSYARAETLQSKAVEESRLGSEHPLESLAFYQLSRAYHAMADRFHHQVLDAGLTLGEWRVLSSLSGPEALGLEELAVRTYIQPYVLDDVLAGLQADGLVAVEGDQAQGTARGTDKGRARVAGLLALARENDEDAMDGLNGEQRAVFKANLRAIRD